MPKIIKSFKIELLREAKIVYDKLMLANQEFEDKRSYDSKIV